ncbi:hypothetical protein OS11_07700 [Dickeya oryzae]
MQLLINPVALPACARNSAISEKKPAQDIKNSHGFIDADFICNPATDHPAKAACYCHSDGDDGASRQTEMKR